jgi:hypothetical protein
MLDPNKQWNVTATKSWAILFLYPCNVGFLIFNFCQGYGQWIQLTVVVAVRFIVLDDAGGVACGHLQPSNIALHVLSMMFFFLLLGKQCYNSKIAAKIYSSKNCSGGCFSPERFPANQHLSCTTNLLDHLVVWNSWALSVMEFTKSPQWSSLFQGW